MRFPLSPETQAKRLPFFSLCNCYSKPPSGLRCLTEWHIRRLCVSQKQYVSGAVIQPLSQKCENKTLLSKYVPWTSGFVLPVFQEEEKRSDAVAMLEESSRAGCLQSSYLLWEYSRKAAVSLVPSSVEPGATARFTLPCKSIQTSVV